MLPLLAGVSILEIGEHISAPFCTKLLAGLGADVIKIEKPHQGDCTRQIGPFPGDEPHNEKSGLFLYLNTAKKGITLNLKTDLGQKIFRELAAKVDIVVENLGATVMDSLGLNYPILEKDNAHLVMTSISPWGGTGPYKDYQAEDITIQAMCGAMCQLGNPEREPLKLGGNTSHYRAGISAFTATLQAFYHAENSGEGQFVDVSEFEVGVHDDIYSVELYMARAEVATRKTTVLLLPCKDGWIYFRVFPHEWPRFRELLGFDIESDERFVTMEKRQQNAQELEELVLPFVLDKTKEEAYQWAQSAKITSGYVANVEDLVKSPQYRSHGYFFELDHPIAGRIHYPGSPIYNIPWKNGRAPLLGEHNKEIIGEQLGYSKSDLVHLRQTGII